jgi:hypothetical protein
MDDYNRTKWYSSSKRDNLEIPTRKKYIGGKRLPREFATADAPEYGFVDMLCLNKILVETSAECPKCDSQRREVIHMSGDDNGFSMRSVGNVTLCWARATRVPELKDIIVSLT